MHYVVLGYDGDDEQAAQRRAAAREEHLAGAAELHQDGTLLFAAGILDKSGALVGSMMVFDFESSEELDHYLEAEPYVTGQVWERVEFCRVQVAPFCLPT